MSSKQFKKNILFEKLKINFLENSKEKENEGISKEMEKII